MCSLGGPTLKKNSLIYVIIAKTCVCWGVMLAVNKSYYVSFSLQANFDESGSQLEVHP